MKSMLISIALFAASLSAADISGNWKGTAEGPNGTIERTFVFKQDGTALTGETNSEYTGKSSIMEGKVEGNNVSFVITAHIQDNEMKLNYKGTIQSSDEMQFDVALPNGGPGIHYVVKRVK